MTDNLQKIILASGSPRRREILENLGVEFQVMLPASETEPVFGEHPDFDSILSKTAMSAQAKAMSVIERAEPGSLVIGADTVVVLGERVLEKPSSYNEAVIMLSELSGKTHKVVTGICAAESGGSSMTSCEVTEVTFRPLSRTEIDKYAATGDPLDKAGAYGIQTKGGLLVEKVNGCYFNVVGLPITALYKLLKNFGYDMMSNTFSGNERTED